MRTAPFILIPLPYMLRDGDDLGRGVACTRAEHIVWRDDTVREGDLKGACLHVRWVARVVPSAGDIHSNDSAVRPSDYECIVRAIRERHMYDAR